MKFVCKLYFCICEHHMFAVVMIHYRSKEVSNLTYGMSCNGIHLKDQKVYLEI